MRFDVKKRAFFRHCGFNFYYLELSKIQQKVIKTATKNEQTEQEIFQ